MAVWTPVPDISLLELDALVNDTDLVPDLPMDVFSEKKTFLVKKFADSQYTYDYGCLEFTSAGVVDIVGTAGEFDDHRSYAIDPLRAMPWMLKNSFGVAMEFRLEDISTRSYLFCQPIVTPAGADALFGVYVDTSGGIFIRCFRDDGGISINTGIGVDPGITIHNRIVVWYRFDDNTSRWTWTVYLNGASGVDAATSHYFDISTATHIYNAYVGYGYVEDTQTGFIGAIRQLKVYDCPFWDDALCTDMSATGIFPATSLIMDFPLDNAVNRVNVKHLQLNSSLVTFPFDQRMVPPLAMHSPATFAFKVFLKYDALLASAQIVALTDVTTVTAYHIYFKVDNAAAADLYFTDDDGAGNTSSVYLGSINYDEAYHIVIDIPDKNMTSYIAAGSHIKTIDSMSDIRALDHYPTVNETYTMYFGYDGWGTGEFNGRIWDIMTFWGTWTTEERSDYLWDKIPSRYSEYYKISDATETAAGATIASRNGIITSGVFTTPTISKPFSIGTLPAGCSYAPWLLHKGELVF